MPDQTDTQQAQPAVQHPFIHIEQRPDPDDPTGFQLVVKTGSGIDDTNQLVATLLLAVQGITGVSADLYAQEIAIARRVALGGPLFPADLAAVEAETDDR